MKRLPFLMPLLLLAGSCSTESDAPCTRIIWRNTPEFNAQLSQFKVSTTEAEVLLKEAMKSLNEGPAIHEAQMIIGDEYFFPFEPSKTKAARLQGYYINGATGTVRYLKVGRRLEGDERCLEEK